MKIIIVHDYFLYKGGGERSMIELAKGLGADMATAFISKDAFNPKDHGIKTFELTKESRFSSIPGFRYLQVQLSFIFKTGFLRNYDVIIHSGDTLNALLRTGGKKNVAYMHTPPRHLFDSYADRIKSNSFLKNLIFVPYAFFNKLRWKFLSKKFDLIITNAATVQKRIKQYLNLDSVIAYPPSDSINFEWRGQKDYYFSWARLYPAKRVDQIVKAFVEMPDKNLIVGSSGPELEKIKEIAKNSPNIQILGWISDDQLLDLVGNSIAVIYIPIREDFGMTPIEANNAGKPTIGVNEGGLQETIIDGQTGVLLNPDFTIEDIKNAVIDLTPQKALEMKEACFERGKLFSKEAFVDKVKSELNKLDIKE